MNVPFWALELAQVFWARAKYPEPFPRDLRPSIKKAVPLSVVMLPRLSVNETLDWLRKSGVVCDLPGKDRPLRACLAARGGLGIALVNGSDEATEQRFSIAHELAHFLRDYWGVRRRIVKRLGAGALAAHDGERPATTQERLQALLRKVPLGFHLHLMERDDAGNPLTASIAQSEDDADRLAYELLAPAEHVRQGGLASEKALLTRRLEEFYGLPSLQASRYAGILLPSKMTDPLLLRLRSIASKR
jgi:IrrE N-terminal-like domain